MQLSRTSRDDVRAGRANPRRPKHNRDPTTFATAAPRPRRLVDTLEWWHRLALVLVERVADNATVLEVDLGRVHVVLPRERVLHPVLVVTLSSQAVSICDSTPGW